MSVAPTDVPMQETARDRDEDVSNREQLQAVVVLLEQGIVNVAAEVAFCRLDRTFLCMSSLALMIADPCFAAICDITASWMAAQRRQGQQILQAPLVCVVDQASGCILRSPRLASRFCRHAQDCACILRITD